MTSIPKVLVDALGWRKGDKVEWRMDAGRLYLVLVKE